MTRERFYKEFGKPQDYGVPVVNEASRVIEVVRLDTTYNLMLNSYRSLPEDNYKTKMMAIWSQAVKDNLEALKDISPEEVLEQSKIAKELLKQGYDVKLELRLVPHYLPNGEVHHWTLYGVFSASVEALRCYWDTHSKQKVFIFTKDGVMEIRHAPFTLPDATNPVGFVGVDAQDDAIILSEI